MSDISHHNTESVAGRPADRLGQEVQSSPSDGSFLERFLNSFFQEKNIRWLLLIGAAIIFGSSLMLVTRAWPYWSPTLRAFTILAYTGSLFAAGHFCRVRLQLNLTYKVLYGLTVLLIPISFLSLSWLSSGTAVQQGLFRSGLIAPFLAGAVFLWFAARTIFDHVLRSRQTTFLISYCLLCMAGALPALTSSTAAFGFLMVSWAVMTAGVVKVNRHVFQLTRQHQLPRVFGFLPVILLGIQFIVLIGVLAVPALPLHWMGLGCVLLAATVLLTARSLMSVFRQTTGDLVRPFPWSVSAPLMVGLCLTVFGVALSFSGFNPVSNSTFAVIPTALLAAGLMMLISLDTRHAAFTWFGLIFLTIAYRCCPVLFSDIVQNLKETTAGAIRRERVPLSMYGLTCVPLLFSLAFAVRQLRSKSLDFMAAPIRQFLAILTSVLFVLSLTDIASAFIVAVANIAVFAVFGMLLKERRLGYLSVVSGVLAIGLAIPALNDMQYAAISNQWVAPLLSAVAVVLTFFAWPDRVLGRVAMLDWLRDRCVGSLRFDAAEVAADRGEGRSSLPILQTLGSAMAIVLSVHWMVTVAIAFSQPLTLPALIQFGCLLSALAIYTLRNPLYFTGLCCNALCVFVGVRWALGENFPVSFLLNATSIGSLVVCLVAGLVLRQTLGTKVLSRLLDVGRGFRRVNGNSSGKSSGKNSIEENRGWRSRVQAFVVPCFDLSFWAMWSLVAIVHLPAVVVLNWPGAAAMIQSSVLPLWTTPVVLLALVGVTIVARDKELGLVASLCVPMLVTAYLPVFGFPLTLAGRLLVWLVISFAAVVVAGFVDHRKSDQSDEKPALAKSVKWLAVQIVMGLLAVSCFVVSAPLNLTALLIGLSLFPLAAKGIGLLRRTGLAVTCNLQALVGVVALIEASGFQTSGQVVQAVLFALCGLSMLVFRSVQGSLHPKACRAWVGVLLSAMVVLFGVCCTGQLATIAVLLVFLGLLFAGAYEFQEAIQKQDRIHVHVVWAILFAGGYFLWMQAFDLLAGIVVPYLLLAISVGLLAIERTIQPESKAAIFRRDLILLARVFPAVISVGIVFSGFTGSALASGAHHSFILMMCAAIYGYLFQMEQRPRFAIPALILLNLSLSILWRSLSWTSIEFYMVPAGFSVLLFSRVLRADLPEAGRKGLQYVGSLMVLLSPIVQVLDGSWQHMLLLLILSVIVIVLAIGLRIRSLVYCGTGFLMVDLLAMVVQSTVDSPTLLWGVGILTGVGIMALAAYCERHREQLLGRLRMLSSELATWD